METNITFTVRYAETDQMGIVHHSNYAVWFEEGRSDFLRSVGVSYSSIEAKGVMLPLYELNCRFISPAKYEDEIIVTTTLKSLSRVRVSFSYQVVNKLNDVIIATGETMHAWTNMALQPINAEKIVPEVFLLLNEGTC